MKCTLPLLVALLSASPALADVSTRTFLTPDGVRSETIIDGPSGCTKHVGVVVDGVYSSRSYSCDQQFAYRYGPPTPLQFFANLLFDAPKPDPVPEADTSDYDATRAQWCAEGKTVFCEVTQ